MVEHKKGERSHPIDSTLVETLDESLKNINTHLYIIGDDEFKNSTIENLDNKILISNWLQLEQLINSSLNKISQ